MNKYQEAISYIADEHLDIHYEGRPMNKDTEMLLTLQELVDKVTPKKAILSQDQHIRYVTTYICPSCGNQFTGKISEHCYHCGQKLDWSEEDENKSN